MKLSFMACDEVYIYSRLELYENVFIIKNGIQFQSVEHQTNSWSPDSASYWTDGVVKLNGEKYKCTGISKQDSKTMGNVDLWE
jgi:hypothetical protein